MMVRYALRDTQGLYRSARSQGCWTTWEDAQLWENFQSAAKAVVTEQREHRWQVKTPEAPGHPCSVVKVYIGEPSAD